MHHQFTGLFCCCLALPSFAADDVTLETNQVTNMDTNQVNNVDINIDTKNEKEVVIEIEKASLPEAISVPSTSVTTETQTETEQMIGEVRRKAFTSAIQAREPVEILRSVTNDVEKIYYFTDIRNMKGKKIVHRWEYNGETMAEIPFLVKSDRWRVWSSKNFLPEWVGTWQVYVVTDSGQLLSQSSLEYKAL